MIVANRTLTTAIAGTVFAASALAIASQFLINATMSENGPVEYADGVLNAIIALTLTTIAILAPRRGGLATKVWIFLSLAAWMWLAADVSGFDDWAEAFLVPDDTGTLLVWALTATAILPVLDDRRLPAASRALLGGGLLLQSLAFAADMGDGSVFHLPGLSHMAPEAFFDSIETLSLAAYVAGTLLIAIPLIAAPSDGNTSLRWDLLVSQPGRLLAIAHEDVSWRIWHFSHAGQAFSDYYADNITRKLDRGKAHRTLGRQKWSKEMPNGGSGGREDKFGGEGLQHFRTIMDLGVTTGSTVVDYGCGSLRIGQHFIRHLDAGHYWGLDVTDRFFRDGLALIDAGTVAVKTPHLQVIGDATLALARKAKPDIIFSIAVMKHVPEAELDTYWKNILGLMASHTVVFVRCDVADRYLRTAAKNWAHTEEAIRAAIARHAPDRRVTFEFTTSRDAINGHNIRSVNVIVICGAGPSLSS